MASAMRMNLPIRCLLLLILPGGLLSCSSGRGDVRPGAEAKTRLEGSRGSIEALCRDFLAALAEKDLEGIQGMGLSKDEFVRIVWPHLPASKPGTNLTSDYVWQSLQMQSRSGLETTLRAHGGHQHEFLGFRFEGKTTDYGSFQVHRETLLKVRHDTGKIKEMRFFGSVLEMDGEYKIFSFVL